MRYFHPFLGRWAPRPLHSVGELHKIRDSLWSVIGWVAQLVEQRIENPRVGGSIPSPATRHESLTSNDVGLFCCLTIGPQKKATLEIRSVSLLYF